MEQQFCEKCHQSGIKVLLRQSEELLCSPCWKGWPPFWDINEEHQELDLDREEVQVDHSFRFTFSTPSMIKDINNTALQNNKSIITSKQTEEMEHTKVSPSTPKLFTVETPILPPSHGPRPIRPPCLNEIEVKITSEENPTQDNDESKDDISPADGSPASPLQLQGDVLFADTLLKHLARKKEKGEKEQLKRYGDIKELEDFVTHILKMSGNWKQSKVGNKQKPDQLPSIKHTFQDKRSNVTLNWWTSSKTLQVIGQAGQKKLAEIEIKLQAGESNENTDEVTMNTQQNTLDKNHTQYEINNVWKAIEELKNQLAILSSNITSKVINANASVVTPTHVEDTKISNSTSNVTFASTSAATATHAEDTSSYNSTSNVTTASASHMTATHAEDTSSSRNSNITTASTNIMTANHGDDINLSTHGGQMQQTGDVTKHYTNKVLKQKIVTEFFKPVSQEDHNKTNELNALQIKINQLKHENRSLAQEVDHLKQQIITMKSQNKNIDSQPENGKEIKKVQKKEADTINTTPSTARTTFK